MDPVGAAASIITLLQLTHKISILCLDIHARVKSAGPDIVRLTDEIKTLRSLLETLSGLASNTRHREPSRLEAVAKAEPILAPCETELEDIEKWLRKVLKSSSQSPLGAIQWALKEKDVLRRLDNISRLKSTLQLALALDQTTILLESHSNILSLRDTVDRTNIGQQRTSIIDWLAAPSRAWNFDDAQKIRSPSTGDWFLKSTLFENWMVSPQSIMWLHGIPGSGKTILCSSIIETLRASNIFGGQCPILHFFFDFSTREQQTTDLFLRSLLAQVQAYSEEIIEPIEALYNRYHPGRQSPRDMELMDALRMTVTRFEQIYVVIDAIDECSALETLLEIIEEISQWNADPLHLLATSRGEKEIEDLFSRISTHQCLMVESAVNNDIQRHVQQSVGKDKKLGKWSPEVQTEIATTLTSKAGGMFRWADCQLRAIRQCKTLKGLREALDSLPTTLDETYSRILDNVDPASAKDAQTMLSWLCFAM